MTLCLAGGRGRSAGPDFAVLQEIEVNGNSVSIRTDKPAPYNIFKVGSPPRLVVELSRTENDWKQKQLTLKQHPLLARIRSGQFQDQPVKIARIVAELKSPADYEATARGNEILLTLKSHSETAAPASSNTEPASHAAAPTPPEALQANPAVVPPLVQAAAQATSAEPPKEKEVSPEPAAPKTAPAARRSEISARETGDGSNPTSLFGRQQVTLDFYDIDVRDLLRTVAEKSGVNVVFGKDVSGTISIQLRDVPMKDAVDTILALKGLRIVVMGKNIVQVLTPKELDDYKINAISMTRVFPINYAKATDVDTQLKDILTTLGGKGKTLVDDRTNSIIVTDTPEGITTIERLVSDLDKPTPQVMIEAKIVEVSLGKNLDLGIQWGAAYTDRSGNQMVTIGASKNSQVAVKNENPATLSGPGFNGPSSQDLMSKTPLNPSGGSDLEAMGSGFSAAQGLGLTFGFVKDVVRLNAALNALQQKRKLKTLSNPKIATLNNKPAVIKSQTSEPYITTETTLVQQAGVTTAQKVNQALSGITLTVTPTINADGRITMKIVPDITNSQPTSIGIPKTTSQQADTTVIVRDGETFVIGGLIREAESDDKAYVPVLGAIPILGHLFKKTSTSRSRSELLVFVTPKIIPY